MTDDPADKLSATRHAVLVLRLVIDLDGNVTGELMDPLTGRRRRFTGLTHVVGAVNEWISQSLHTFARTGSFESPPRQGRRSAE